MTNIFGGDNMSHFEITGSIVDVVNKNVFSGTLVVENGKIADIIPSDEKIDGPILLPGFVDSHIHLDSSLLVPTSFGAIACVHGTVATVSDPHEIANVLGLEGVRYMINNSKQTPLKIYFGAPSCVPATGFETAGATITADDIETLFREDGLLYLSEMMNYPGVLMRDSDVMAKIAVAKKYNKLIDGHAPGVVGEDIQRYIDEGISTDHECYLLSEARDKINRGMKVLIREGSAAKNYKDLSPLIASNPDMVMFCTDDTHPDDLVQGHINLLVKRALNEGYNLMDVLRCVSFNPVSHYGLDVGLLQVGDPADFIMIDNFEDFNVLRTYINGVLVADKGRSRVSLEQVEHINNFNVKRKKPEDFRVSYSNSPVKVIGAIEGQLVTEMLEMEPKKEGEYIVADTERDMLKITVVNRYEDVPPAVAWVYGFGLDKGAIASSIAHDSHNIVAVGTNDEDLCEAINSIIDNKGGISVVYDGKVSILPLPIAGLMTDEDGYDVAKKYIDITRKTYFLGSKLHAPHMTLSFMALLVIPNLKISDKGLFDSQNFKFL